MSKGTKYILLSTSLFFVAKLLVKIIPAIHAFEIVLFRAIISFVICSTVIYHKKISFWGTHRKDLLIRGVFGSLGLLTFFYSLQNMPLATATALIDLNPLFTIFFAIWILKEKPNPKQWVYFALAALGVFILRGGSLDLSTLDFLIGISSAMFAGIAYNYIRKLKDKEDPQTIILYLSLVAIPVFLPLSYFTWSNPTPLEWAIMLSIGIVTQFAQYFLTLAHQASQASHIVHYTYVGVIGAVLFGWVLFGEALSAVSLIGIGIIAVSIYMIHKYKFHKRLG